MGRFRAGIDHPHFLHPRISVDHQLRHLALCRRRQPIACSLIECLMQRIDDTLRPMAEDQRSPGPDIIDEDIAVLILYAAAIRPLDKYRHLAHMRERAHRGINASRHAL